MPLKKVRMLLRVSSNQQLEADGDLSVQRQNRKRIHTEAGRLDAG